MIFFLSKKKMSTIIFERLQKIKSNTILEDGLNIYSLQPFVFEQGNISLKWIYNRNVFLKISYC